MPFHLIFTSHPSNPNKDIIDGIQDYDALEELASLYNLQPIILTQGNISLSLPTEDNLKKIEIKNAELKNILNKYKGNIIYIHKDDPSITAINSKIYEIETI